MALKVLDAGLAKLVITGDDKSEVEEALRKYLQDGSKVIAAVAPVGKAWAAACTLPARLERLDKAVTLDLTQPVSYNRDDAITTDDESLCTLEKSGFTTIIRGPTKEAVQAKIDDLRHFGATILTEPEQEDGSWVAVCDSAGTNNSGYRW